MHDVKAQLLATVRATEDAYWDLVQALRAAEVQRGSLALARGQLEVTERQIAAGILPPSDSIASESLIAQRQLGLLDATTGIQQAADRLRRVLNLPRVEWGRALLPSDPPRFDEAHPDAAEAAELARRNRPELAALRVDVERAGLDVRAARADRLPQLDLGASYGLIGQRTGYGETLDQLAGNNVKAWSVSATFSWTPLMLAARAQVEAALAQQRGATTQLEQQRLDIALELRDNLRALDAAGQQVRVAARFRELARRALEAEQRKFANGTSNNFFVAQRQSDVAQSQLAELAAVIRHRKARTALEAAMGVLLEARGVRIDVAGR